MHFVGYPTYMLYHQHLKFVYMNLSRVYTEHNMSADCLSNDALNVKAGLLSFSYLLEGEIIEEGMI